MGLETVAGTDIDYYLIAYDKQGSERTDDPDGLVSARLCQVLQQEPITDVFLITHGWKGDIEAAREQYARWIRAMHRCRSDIERVKAGNPQFRPLLIGLHWPSLPWGDEGLQPGVVSFDLAVDGRESWLADAAEKTAETPRARAALEVLFDAAQATAQPTILPPEVVAAYRVLDEEMFVGASQMMIADRAPFDPDKAYRASLSEVVPFDGGLLDGLLSPLVQLSFWKMKQRAQIIGEGGGSSLLKALADASTGKAVRFHLMGHSFGCIVASAMVRGLQGTPMKVQSLALIQGALSLWSFAAESPAASGAQGYFHRLIINRQVVGPIITTQSERDTAVCRLYPLAAGLGGPKTFDVSLPKYGAIGQYGIAGVGVDPLYLKMLDVDQDYGFRSGQVYNLDSSHVIAQGGGFSGAHNDIAHPQVAHAIWQATLA